MISFPEYPHSVYRFRPYTPLSLKELQYGEIFFVSNDELNDPYDTKNPHLFEGNKDFYERLITNLLYPASDALKLDFAKLVKLDEIANYLGKEDRLQDELIQLIGSDEFYALCMHSFATEIKDLVPFFILRFKERLHALGGICYIASFSKVNFDPVLWSHYSNHHRGFCLCFSIENSSFRPKGELKKSNFFANLQFEEVVYSKKNKTVNGAFLFTSAIAGIESDEDKVKEYWNQRRQSYLTKYTSWVYEQEVRIIRDDWFNTRSSRNGKIKKPISDRIFHYDQKQLTGIIFGSRMTDSEKEEIRHIIYEMRRQLPQNEEVLPIFLFHQAVENPTEFRMNIECVEGVDTLNKGFQMDKYQEKLEEYNRLKEFYARRKTDNTQ